MDRIELAVKLLLHDKKEQPFVRYSHSKPDEAIKNNIIKDWETYLEIADDLIARSNK